MLEGHGQRAQSLVSIAACLVEQSECVCSVCGLVEVGNCRCAPEGAYSVGTTPLVCPRIFCCSQPPLPQQTRLGPLSSSRDRRCNSLSDSAPPPGWCHGQAECACTSGVIAVRATQCSPWSGFGNGGTCAAKLIGGIAATTTLPRRMLTLRFEGWARRSLASLTPDKRADRNECEDESILHSV